MPNEYIFTPPKPTKESTHSGKKIGTKNKYNRFSLNGIRRVIKKHDANPFEFLAKVMTDENNPLQQRLYAAVELCPYLAAKQRNVVVSGEIKNGLNVTINLGKKEQAIANPSIDASIEQSKLVEAMDFDDDL